MHPVEAYGLRVSCGRRPHRLHRRHRAVRAARRGWPTGADLLLAEASFRHGDDNPPGIHLTGTDCGELAGRAASGGW